MLNSIDSGTAFIKTGVHGVKKFILNSDNFGLSQDDNRAVLNGYNNGFLKSTSLTANGEAFDSAVNEILPECQKISIGVHLNLTSGKALTRANLLTDDNRNFNLDFLFLWFRSSDKEVLQQIEKEFRAQIEKVAAIVKPTHIDSMSHIHAIPKIFEITCKLAKEYNIPYVRTHFEEFYVVPDAKSNINLKYPINLCKIVILNILTKINKKTINKYDLNTNDYLVGITYSGMMNNKTLEAGLKTLSDEDDFTVEAFIHPRSYLRNINDWYAKEFKLTQDKLLEDNIYRMGYEITNFKA